MQKFNKSTFMNFFFDTCIPNQGEKEKSSQRHNISGGNVLPSNWLMMEIEKSKRIRRSKVTVITYIKKERKTKIRNTEPSKY